MLLEFQVLEEATSVVHREREHLRGQQATQILVLSYTIQKIHVVPTRSFHTVLGVLEFQVLEEAAPVDDRERGHLRGQHRSGAARVQHGRRVPDDYRRGDRGGALPQCNRGLGLLEQAGA